MQDFFLTLGISSWDFFELNVFLFVALRHFFLEKTVFWKYIFTAFFAMLAARLFFTGASLNTKVLAVLYLTTLIFVEITRTRRSRLIAE